MNENEFEKLIKEAMIDESSPSDILNAKLKQKIKKKYFIQKSFRGIKTAVACVAVLVTGAVVLVNSNEGISNKLSEIPVVGNVAKVMTVNDFNKKDIISQDNDMSYTTPDKTEDTMENAPYNSEVTEEAVQDNKKTNSTPQKTNKTYEKKAQTTKPKTKSLNNKTESKEITESPEAVKETVVNETVIKENTVNKTAINETMENADYSLSIAKSVDAHGEQTFDIYQGETTGEAVFETEESAKIYEKLSDLYDEGYDYRSEISEKIKNQVKERMILNPEIVYNIGEDFTITGDEEFYINDKNELVIVFGEGVIAPKELGKVEFNIGITN